MQKTEKILIKINLEDHAVSRLVERQPIFMDYTNEKVISTLNTEPYKSGILHRRKHHDFSDYVLQVINLHGVFYLKKREDTDDIYDASTFKLLNTPRGSRSTHAKEVKVVYEKSQS